MNSRERVMAVVNRKIPDRIPKDLSWGLCPALEKEFQKRTGKTDYYEYFDLDVRMLDFAPTRVKRDFSRYFKGRDKEYGFTVDEWGVGRGKSTDSSLHFEHIVSPLKNCMNEMEAENFPLPDFLEPYRYAHFKSDVEKFHKKNLAVCGMLVQTIFEKAWAVRGFEETMMDMLVSPEAISILFDRITELRIQQAKILVEAGIDILMLGDDVGMQTGMLIGADTWRKFLKPRLAKIIKTATSLRPGLPVFYHSCGNPGEIIPDLIEIGVTILNPIQPECFDLQEVKEKYGAHLAFWGGISAQTNLSFGTPEQVKQEVKYCIETLGKNGGYFIGPNHVVEPEVPWENLEAFFEAVEEYGRYET